ncbi:MAG: glycine cleavage system aminomethyltransferase GcvT [Cellvibrionales bacterium]|nr:glycine cleavage system aminomethyltransferase GcvT [Cellvibrionales bacterium]
MSDLKQTALHSWHVNLGAKMVEFAGYDMPVQYPSGVISEHNQTRESASLFDVSHMGQFFIASNDIDQLAVTLEGIFPANLVDLPINKQAYTLLLNETGGIIDDLMIAKKADGFLLVVNASRKIVNLDYLSRRLESETIEVMEDYALLALQGPKAHQVLEDLGVHTSDWHFMHGRNLNLADVSVWATRSGYTGEDGFELSVINSEAEKLADTLLTHALVAPAGLGARDSLRLEAGLCLWGHEIDEEITPSDACLNWAISPARRKGGKREGNYIAANLVQDQMATGADYRRIGLSVEGRAIVRANTILYTQEGHQAGRITSGTFSPTLKRPIAMAKIHNQYADLTTFVAKVRNKDILLNLTDMPFVKSNYYRG